jgi:large subunit ribosomal protein L4
MSVTAPVVDQTGKSKGTVDLPAFCADPVNEATMHQALVRQLANARQGTHNTKKRGEVSGGGRKPYRQKGTGNARQGSTRSPQWRHGGIVFGPRPRDYDKDMPRKQRRLALRGAFATKANEGQITVVESFSFEKPKTKAVTGLLTEVKAGRRVLLVLGSHDEILEKSARNVPEIKVTLAGNLSVRDLLTAETVLMTKDAVDHVEEAWS